MDFDFLAKSSMNPPVLGTVLMGYVESRAQRDT